MKKIICIAMAFCISNIQSQTSTSKTLGGEITIQPDGNLTSIFEPISLEKGHSYIITVTGTLKPDYSNHIWGCHENTVSRNFICSVGVIEPLANITTPIIANNLNKATCGPTANYTDFLTACVSNVQFTQSFIFKDVSVNKVIFIFFQNNKSTVEYNHSCGNGNPKGGFEFPIILKADSKISITKI